MQVVCDKKAGRGVGVVMMIMMMASPIKIVGSRYNRRETQGKSREWQARLYTEIRRGDDMIGPSAEQFTFTQASSRPVYAFAVQAVGRCGRD